MNAIQTKLAELQELGWTLAAIADEVGTASVTIEKWKAGERNPANLPLTLTALDGLRRRKRVPKQKRYKATPPA